MHSKHKTFNRQAYTTYSTTYNHPPHSPKRRLRSWAIICLILVAFGLGSYFVLMLSGRATAKNDTSASVAQTVVAKPAPTASPASLAKMDEQIRQVINQYPGVQIAVSITDLNSNKSYHYGVSAGYLGASTAKLITASLFLHEVENGNQSLDTMVGDYPASYQLKQLIEQSDNDAWVALNGLLGHDQLQVWANHVGLINYDVTNNILTSDDMATLLTKLYQNKLLNADNTKLLLSYMQNATETQHIESALPEGVKVYHKAGWLEDRVHDAAIIDDGKNPYVLVIFSKTDGVYDTSAGQAIFHAITAATVTTFIKS